MNIFGFNITNIKKIQREEYKNLIDDFDDISTNNINYLIRYSSNNYIVFLDAVMELDWEITDKYDKEHNDKEKEKYISKVEYLQHQPVFRYLTTKQKKEFGTMLGAILVLILEGAYDNVQNCIDQATTYMKNRNCEITRKWQLISCLSIVCFLAIIIIITKHNFEYISIMMHIGEDTLKKTGYISLGIVGAALSIIQKSGSQCYDCEAGRMLVFLEVLSRMLASIISSFLIVYLFELDLIFSAFKNENHISACLIVICIIAGFSERLVPSIISKFEINEINKED